MKFTYTGIRVRNLERSVKFYKEVMGMKVVLRGKMGHGGEYVHLKSPGSAQRLELNWYPEGSKYYAEYGNGEELDHLAFWVKGVGKKFRELVEKGVEATVEPFEEDGYELAFVKDPDGIWIELIGHVRRKGKPKP